MSMQDLDAAIRAGLPEAAVLTAAAGFVALAREMAKKKCFG